MTRRRNRVVWIVLWLSLLGCPTDRSIAPREKPPIPLGYVDRLQIQVNDRVLSFGPFVGYYFKPRATNDLSRLDFICFNERSFYTRDLPPNARLFEGRARWQQLPDSPDVIPMDGNRIVPVFFPQAPDAWLASRPQPQDAFVHFHSAYDDRGAVRYGYWLNHVALEQFTYDMGGRVSSDSPLYHTVEPGPDHKFARIIEFDHGPGE